MSTAADGLARLGLIALLALTPGTLLLSSTDPVEEQSSGTGNYDADDDGLIEVEATRRVVP